MSVPSPRRCTGCQIKKKCPGYDYYSPFEVSINYCQNQIIWVIQEVLTLGPDQWPPEGKETGYTDIDPDIRTPSRPRTSNQLIRDVRADVEYRLKRTNRDGGTLRHELIQFHVYTYKELSQAAKDALNYISGLKTKKLKYTDWLSQRERRNNANNILRKM